ncbi:MAG: chromate transporter [Eubacteriales bacterium]|nr:chromate transporter [Eubacteriales bacterium]
MIVLELFLTFLEIGAFTFGGGYAMLPLIQDAVAAHGWMSTEELVNFIAVSESTPGPFAVNAATYVGSTVGGFFGAVAATLGVVLPSFVIILLIAAFFMKFKDSAIVKGCMSGLRPATVGLIASAVVTVGWSVFSAALAGGGGALSLPFLSAVVIFCGAAALAFTKKSPILIIGLSAVVGIAVGYAGELLG